LEIKNRCIAGASSLSLKKSRCVAYVVFLVLSAQTNRGFKSYFTQKVTNHKQTSTNKAPYNQDKLFTATMETSLTYSRRKSHLAKRFSAHVRRKKQKILLPNTPL
jgi:hypothetical protein